MKKAPTAALHVRRESRGRVQGVRTPSWDDLRFSNITGILQKKKLWFIGVEVEQETSAPPPKKNSGSAPARDYFSDSWLVRVLRVPSLFLE